MIEWRATEITEPPLMTKFSWEELESSIENGTAGGSDHHRTSVPHTSC